MFLSHTDVSLSLSPKKNSLNTLLIADVYIVFKKNNNRWWGWEGHKVDRNSLEGNIDLRTVQWIEMPLKKLPKNLWLSSPSVCFTHSVPLYALPET